MHKEVAMELSRRFVARYPTRMAAYLALQVALMRRFKAQGGTEEEFCRRLAPAFHRRYSALLPNHRPGAPVPPVCTPLLIGALMADAA
ncbi:MAG TPA: hypothetical protein VFH27_01745 [Longimicrobiaceae bacterium]|nr:hypothetical protein [Longimicrobiaceae bacterium]